MLLREFRTPHSLRLLMFGMWAMVFLFSGLFVIWPQFAQPLGMAAVLRMGGAGPLPPAQLTLLTGLHMFSAVATMMSFQALLDDGRRRR